MPKSRIPSPSRSQSGLVTPRHHKPRGPRSVGSPARSNTSVRLTCVIQNFKDKNMDSFRLSPLTSRRSVLNDNTDIEEPKRNSWWKKLNDTSRDIMEVLENDKQDDAYNVMEEYMDAEVLSQEKKTKPLDLPDSSDSDSIISIVIPQRKLFTQKENHPQNKFAQLLGTRESMAKLNKTNIVSDKSDKTIVAGTKKLFSKNSKPRSKPAFPSELLRFSPDKTVNKTAEVKGQVRNLFGNRAGFKRKNKFADFIASESEDEPEIQPKVFGFQKKTEIPSRRVSTASRGTRDHSPTSSITNDIDLEDWKLLPSSTMVQTQLEAMIAESPAKKARLSKLSVGKESETGTNSTAVKTNRTMQSNRSVTSKNKSKSNSINPELQNVSKVRASEGEKEAEVEEEYEENIQDVTEDKENEMETDELTKAEGGNEIQKENAIQEIQTEAEDGKVEDSENEIDAENARQEMNETDDRTESEDKNEIEEENASPVKDTNNTTNSDENDEVENEIEEENASLEMETDEAKKVVDGNDIEKENDEDENDIAEEVENNEEEIEGGNNNIEEKSVSQVKETDEAKKAEEENDVEKEDDEDEMEVGKQSAIQEMESEELKEAEDGNDEDENEESRNQIEKEDKNDEDEIEKGENEIEEDENETEELKKAEDGIVEGENDEGENEENRNEIEEEDENNKDEIEIGEENVSQQIESDVDENEDSANEIEGENESQEMEVEDSINAEEEDNEEENESLEVETHDPTDLEDIEIEEHEVDEENESQEIQDQSQEIENDNDEVEQEGEQSAYEEENGSEDVINNSVGVNDGSNDEGTNDDDLFINGTEEDTPNVTHDTTGRNRRKDETNLKSPEAVLRNDIDHLESFTAKNRNTSVRRTSMIKSLHIRPSLAPPRESTGFSDGTKNSSAEGSGWDSHRTTRKTLRQTFGRDFTPRKSLRALVMEKSAKRHTAFNDVDMPRANSTELPEDSGDNLVADDNAHEISKRTRQTTLEIYLKKIKNQNMENKKKLEEEVRGSLGALSREINPFKVPSRPFTFKRATKPVQTKPKTKTIKSMIPIDELPQEFLEDMKYKPPKRFQPSNASWITKRLYKFLETKLEAKYDYKARIRAEKLVETIYNFAKDLRRHEVAPSDAVEVLKHEMARLSIVTTHFEFYQFFHDYMPREVRVKVVPDVVNKIPLPRHGVFTDILRGNTVQG